MKIEERGIFLSKNVRRVDKAKVRHRKNTAFRMNLLFFSIFVLFSVLIFRLGYLQIVKHEDYVGELERKEEIAVNTSVPRGRIFDSEGRIFVDNHPKKAITYTKTSATTSAEILATAEKLATMIEQDTKKITLGDKRDFWILLNPNEAKEKVSTKEVKAINEDSDLSDREKQRKINRLTRERITDAEINSFSEEQLEVLAIYREMMSGYAFSPQIIKSDDVTDEEYAAISERLGEKEMIGVNTTTDWDRERKSSNTILGTTTNPTEGIPKSHLDFYLARDYLRNDRVGRSFIEQYYEDLLQGQKSIMKAVKDRTGKVIETKTVREGEPGKDLVLTIDSELQTELEEIVANKLMQIKARGSAQALDRMFLVMLNPKNGEVLSLVGKQIVRNPDTGRNEIRDYAFGTFTDAYVAGSSIKGATVLTGYEYGAAKVGETKIDEMLQIGRQKKSSLFNKSFNRIAVNDVTALERSSNVYMYKTAIALGNGSYRRGSLSIDKDLAFERLSNGYASFGLGVETGIDLPGEASGFTVAPDKPGLVLDYSIGQFATYTTMQLAQYVGTIANDGYRVAPKVLKEIREPSPDGVHFGPLVQESETKILNRINNTDREIERVKQGMHRVYYGSKGTAKQYFVGKPYEAAGKTGTAESEAVVNGRFYRTITLSHVGFAPYKDPEVAYAVLIPHVTTSTNYVSYQNEVVTAALDKYFEVKAKKNEIRPDSSPVLTIKPPYEEE